MAGPESHSENRTYRVILLHPDYGVLAKHVSTGTVLPQVDIPKLVRPARALQVAMQALAGADAIVLDILPEPGDPSICIAELLSKAPPMGLAPVALDELHVSEITEKSRTVVRAICAGESGDRGPFSRMGWIYEAMLWIQRLHGAGADLICGISQHNTGNGFSLVRFALQDGTAYWLKAAGEPNKHEFSITAELARICPNRLPPIIAMRRDWNAWVMAEAGEPLDRNSNLDVAECSVLALAELQKKTVGHIEQLVAAGAADQRLEILLDHVGELVGCFEEAMDRQTSTGVPRIGCVRLREMGTILQDACGVMKELGTPVTILHNDLNPGNILVREGACVFTDWCEACIGNPFANFQHLLSLFAGSGGDTEAKSLCLRQAYRGSWRERLSDDQIQQAFTLAPLVAIASALYGRGGWLHPLRKHDSHSLNYACRLARALDHEARNPQLLESLCA